MCLSKCWSWGLECRQCGFSLHCYPFSFPTERHASSQDVTGLASLLKELHKQGEGIIVNISPSGEMSGGFIIITKMVKSNDILRSSLKITFCGIKNYLCTCSV